MGIYPWIQCRRSVPERCLSTRRGMTTAVPSDVGRAVRWVVGRASETLRTYSQTVRVATTHSPGFSKKSPNDHSATPWTFGMVKTIRDLLDKGRSRSVTSNNWGIKRSSWIATAIQHPIDMGDFRWLVDFTGKQPSLNESKRVLTKKAETQKPQQNSVSQPPFFRGYVLFDRFLCHKAFLLSESLVSHPSSDRRGIRLLVRERCEILRGPEQVFEQSETTTFQDLWKSWYDVIKCWLSLNIIYIYIIT